MDYNTAEAKLLPLIRRKAQRYRGVMDLDDAIQEGRIVLYHALKSYRPEDQPDLARYVGRCLTNAFATQWHADTAQKRMPRQATFVDGKYTSIPKPAASFDEAYTSLPSDHPCPEAQALAVEDTERVRDIVRVALRSLNEREQSVLLAIVQPPPEIPVHAFDCRFNQECARYLGLNKNQYDWALFKVRETLSKLLENNGDDRWPKVFQSDSWNDVSLLNDTISANGLDSVSIGVEESLNDKAGMVCRKYPWGCFLSLRLKKRTASFVIVGRLNRLSGVVYGKIGHKKLPIKWFASAMKHAQEA